MGIPTISERLLARRLATESWILADGNPEVAREIFTQMAKEEAIDPALVAILLQLAIKLFELWFSFGGRRNG